jgi:hypothetical protein
MKTMFGFFWVAAERDRAVAAAVVEERNVRLVIC